VGVQILCFVEFVTLLYAANYAEQYSLGFFLILIFSKFYDIHMFVLYWLDPD